MASYAISYFNCCITDKDIIGSILTENLGPSNFIKVKKRDNFMPHHLKENS